MLCVLLIKKNIGTQCDAYMCLLFKYLQIQRPCGKEANACFANEGHLRFVSLAFGFHSHCGHWKARYMSELFSLS